MPPDNPQILNASVVGVLNDSDSIYVGRPSKWGNPFIIGKDGTRKEVIEKYSVWFWQQPDLIDALPELQDKNLICWCAPNRCHADFLLQAAGVSRFWCE